MTKPSIEVRGTGIAGLLIAIVLVTVALPAQRPATPACPPANHDRASLLTLKSNGFAVADSAERARLALALTACLADPDPALRDGIAFEGLSSLLRGRQLAPPTIRAISSRLQQLLTAPDPDGFARPFAALVLSEVARTDRVEPWMTAEERRSLVHVGTEYLKGIRDHRGFDERAGWRHGVAHAADLLMQLAYNPALERAELDAILDAVATQVAPAGHAYIYGEPERLARPVVAVARRGLLTPEEWNAWLARVYAPAPLAAWSEAYATQAGLAKRHDTMAFLSILYVSARAGEPAYLAPLIPGLEAGLRALP